MTKCYRVAGWSQVFETAESRKYKQLNWVSLPCGPRCFSTHGYQTLLDDFGDEAAAMYGAWCALVAVAASCHCRGVLANSRGAAMKPAHIARISGLPCALFERLIDWAARNDVGWLEQIDADQLTSCDNPGPPGDDQENNRATERNPNPNETQHNQTSAAARAAAEAEEKIRSIDGNQVVIAARKLAKATKHARNCDREWVWAVAWISESLTPGFCSETAGRIASRSVRSPRSYIDGAMRKECDARGLRWPDCASGIPTAPPPKGPTHVASS